MSTEITPEMETVLQIRIMIGRLDDGMQQRITLAYGAIKSMNGIYGADEMQIAIVLRGAELAAGL